MDKQPLSGQQAVLFADPAKLSSFSQTKQVKVTNRHLEENDLDKHDYSNFFFDNVDADRFFVQYAKLTNSTFKNTVFNIASFSRSTLTHVTFENITFNESAFIQSSLIDVKFLNCTFNDSKFSGLKGKATFINSTLNAPDFYENEAILEFENSTITNEANPREEMFGAQKLPASISLKDSTLIGANFTGTMTSFTANGGQIVDTGLGDQISNVTLDHVKVDIAMGGTIQELHVSNSDLVKLAIGETLHNVSISDCKPSDKIAIMSTKIGDISISNCDVKELIPSNSQIGSFTLKNAKIGRFDIHNSTFDELSLSNIELLNANLEHATAKTTTPSSIRFTPGGSIKDSGSNIKLH